MAKFNYGAIIVATTNHHGGSGHEIIAGNLYHAGHGYGHESKADSLWVVNEQGVNSVYPEAMFERANIFNIGSAQ